MLRKSFDLFVVQSKPFTYTRSMFSFLLVTIFIRKICYQRLVSIRKLNSLCTKTAINFGSAALLSIIVFFA